MVNYLFKPEILLNYYLSINDRLVFLFIDEYKEYIDIQDIKDFLNCTRQTVSKSIQNLNNFKYICIDLKNNNHKKIRINKTHKEIYKPLNDLIISSVSINKEKINEILLKIFKENEIKIDSKELINNKKSMKNKLFKEDSIQTIPKYTNKKETSFKLMKTESRSLDSIKASFDKEVKNKKERKRKMGSFVITNEEREIIDYWYNLGLSKYDESKKSNKSFEDMLRTLRRVIRGSFYMGINDLAEFNFKPSIEDFKVSIRKFSLAALNPNYKPVGDFKEFMRKCNLGTFLFNPFGKTPQTRSFFLYYLSYEPDYVDGVQYENFEQAIQRWEKINFDVMNRQVMDIIVKKDNILKFFGKQYLENIITKYKEIARIYNNREFSLEYQTCFIRAVESLAEFIEKNHKRLRWRARWIFRTASKELPWNLVKTAREFMYGDQKFTPKLFLDPSLYGWKIEKYLNLLGWFKKSEEQSNIEDNFGRVETISLKDYVDGKDAQISYIYQKNTDPTKDYL